MPIVSVFLLFISLFVCLVADTSTRVGAEENNPKVMSTWPPKIHLNPDEHPVGTRFLSSCPPIGEENRTCVLGQTITEWATSREYVRVHKDGWKAEVQEWVKASEVGVVEILPKQDSKLTLPTDDCLTKEGDIVKCPPHPAY